MRPSALASVLEGDPYLNAHELALRAGNEGSDEYDAALAKQHGRFLGRRLVFEATFVRGQEVRYGALNAGTMGTLRYGAACAILKDGALASVALLPGDSLRLYADDDSVDLPRLAGDVGTWASRADVAVVKHHEQVCRICDDAWPHLMCHGNHFIEVIFLERVAAATMREVRLRESDVRLRRDAAEDNYDTATDEEKVLFLAMLRIEGAAQGHGIPVETLPDD
jgi:hypothetical protein